MKHPRWMTMLAALCATASTPAQVVAPAEVNLFTNDFPPREPRIVRFNQPSPPPQAAPVREDQQTLLFQNGRQLRGELAELTKDEIVWQRKDASEALRFPRGEVRRVQFGAVEMPGNSSAINAESTAAKGSATASPATIKLPGADWLRGALTSADGQTFTLEIKGGAPLQLARTQIEWLHFGPKTAPAYGMGDGPMALEGWLAGGTPRIESKDGTLTVHDTRWIGRTLATPARFEVAFEVPESSEEGLRLWLQPFNPQPNSYGSGTVQFRFGRKQLGWLVYHGDMQSKNVDLPAAAQAEKGPARYRVLYDGPKQQVILLRNGRQIGDFSLKPKVEQAGGQTQQRQPRGLCFDRDDNGEEGKLQFRRLSVRPWDGDLPQADASTEANQDRLSTATPPPLMGALEAVREKELVFAGKTVPLAADTFVQFAPTPASLGNPEALLSFGEQGEVSLTEMRISEGKVRGRSIFAPALELAASSLQAIALAPGATAAPAVGDLLVFKNGDELPGALIRAATGGPLRWRLASGQEIDFQTGRVAGVRLTTGAEGQPSGAIELRSGERLRGTATALDERQLRWQHPLLGELAVDRSQLWRVYPNPSQSLRDSGQDPDRWLRDSTKTKRFFNYSRVRPQAESWLALDGRFILRARENNSGEQTLGPWCELGNGLDRFELRLTLASPSETPGTLNIGLTAPNDGGISINLSSYYLYLYVRKSSNSTMNREIPIRDKIGEGVRMLNLRAFVDGPAGTVDFFLNGYFIGRTGQAASERVQGIGRNVTIDTYAYGRTQTLLTDVTITPWTGELPRFGGDAPATALANGDAAVGTPVSLAEGRWRLESEIGPLDLPAEKVQAVEFGGTMQPVGAAGRLRLTDGSALLVDRFEWAAGQVTAHHATFGDLQLPGSAVRELIYDPAPVRPPMLVDPKKTARKEDAAQAAVRQ